ncbi:Caffeine resistance protein 5 [Venturia nashicola]|uniref:Caffeine resistance protein 5 n=1 Tax=Venturia nashicola TaxID=86259 RepID=A0A4Z1P504_9PEZI|nr:Caffeine resistance protein 5 [Venturia nashicola]TLD34739.1 Caffeine resistance protein 5 [Venturia nashicola]
MRSRVGESEYIGILSIATERDVAECRDCTAQEIQECYRLISLLREKVVMNLYMEINLSCPNINGKPPPAYDQASLLEYLIAVREAKNEFGAGVKVGIKTPPYSNPRDFGIVKGALMDSFHGDVPIDFITATNTLGTSLLLQAEVHEESGMVAGWTPTLSSADKEGIGGLAGSPLHPLALGNVRMLRRILDAEDELRGISIIGIGGVSDAAGYSRMRSVGAEIVGVGTALGRKGVGIFQRISYGGKARL